MYISADPFFFCQCIFTTSFTLNVEANKQEHAAMSVSLSASELSGSEKLTKLALCELMNATAIQNMALNRRQLPFTRSKSNHSVTKK